MKVTVELNENQLAKFGITEETPKDMIQDIFDNAIASQIPYRFVLRCVDNVYGDEEYLWTKGNTYRVCYNDSAILANSEVSDFEGTYMDEETFLNCFTVEMVSPEVAHAMCFEAGYTDLFEHFLPESERPDFKDFYIMAKEDDDLLGDKERSIKEGETYKVEYSPLSQAFRVKTGNGFRLMNDLDFEFEVTQASPEVAEYMIKATGYASEFYDYIEAKKEKNSTQKIER